MADADNRMPLRSIEDLTRAHEWLFEKQQKNEVDSKTADALNTTLKGAVYLRAKLRLDYVKILIAAQMKKVIIPDGMLPEITESKQK